MFKLFQCFQKTGQWLFMNTGWWWLYSLAFEKTLSDGPEEAGVFYPSCSTLNTSLWNKKKRPVNIIGGTHLIISRLIVCNTLLGGISSNVATQGRPFTSSSSMKTSSCVTGTTWTHTDVCRNSLCFMHVHKSCQHSNHHLNRRGFRHHQWCHSH